MNLIKTVLMFPLRHKKITAVIGLLLVLVFIFKPFGVFGSNNKAGLLKTEKVGRGDLTTTVSVSGMVEAENIATMGFLSIGRISYLGVKEGDIVTEGQILANLDTTQARQSASAAEATYKSYQSAVDKVYDDIQKNRYTADDKGETQTQKTSREQAEMARDSSYQSYQSAKKQLDNLTIIAPFDGIVTSVNNIEVNQNVAVGSGSSITVVGGKMRFKANVDETEYNRLQVGLLGQITLDAFPNEKITGQIIKIGSSAVKLSTGGSIISVEVSLPEDSRLKNGLNGDIDFPIVAKQGVLIIPKVAVKKENGQQYVYLKAGNEKKRQDVTTGESLGSLVEVVSGINEGDEIVISDGQK